MATDAASIHPEYPTTNAAAAAAAAVVGVSELRAKELELLELCREQIQQHLELEQQQQQQQQHREMELYLLEKCHRMLAEEEEKEEQQQNEQERQQQQQPPSPPLPAIEASQSLFLGKDDDDDDDGGDFDDDDLITLERLLPKYLDPKRTCCIEKDELQTQFVESFRNNFNREGTATLLDYSKFWSGFELRVEPVERDKWNIIFTGRPKLIQSIVSAFDAWMEAKIKYHNRDVILSNGISKTVEIHLSAAQQPQQPIGAHLHGLPLSRLPQQPHSLSLGGMFLDVTDLHGLLARALSSSSSSPSHNNNFRLVHGGTFLCRVNDAVCETAPKFKRIFRKAQQATPPVLRLDLMYIQSEHEAFLANMETAMNQLSSSQSQSQHAWTDAMDMETELSMLPSKNNGAVIGNPETMNSAPCIQKKPAKAASATAKLEMMIDPQPPPSSSIAIKEDISNNPLTDGNTTTAIAKTSKSSNTGSKRTVPLESNHNNSAFSGKENTRTTKSVNTITQRCDSNPGQNDDTTTTNSTTSANKMDTPAVAAPDGNYERVNPAAKVLVGTTMNVNSCQGPLRCETMDPSSSAKSGNHVWMDKKQSRRSDHPHLEMRTSTNPRRVTSKKVSTNASEDPNFHIPSRSTSSTQQDESSEFEGTETTTCRVDHTGIVNPPASKNDATQTAPVASHPATTETEEKDSSATDAPFRQDEDDDDDDDLFPDLESDAESINKEADNDNDDDDDLFPDVKSDDGSRNEAANDDDDDDLFPDISTDDESNKEVADEDEGDLFPDMDSAKGQNGNDDKKPGKKSSRVITADGRRKQIQGQQSYKRFRSKFDALVREEFCIPTGAHKLAVFGALWENHKKLFGKDCSESCNCVLAIPTMAETVLQRILNKPSGKPTDIKNVSGCYPIGLAGNFARTFIPLLKKTYGTEGSTKLLERLLQMWKLHVKNRNFGLKCKEESCECAEGWDLVFHKGTLPDEAAYQKKNDIRVQLGAVPKKRKFTEVAVNKKDELRYAQGRINSHSAKALRKEYEIDFDCKTPLPFYCVTHNSDHGSHCKIWSVSPYSKIPVDPRLQANTIVLFSSDGEGRHMINTYQDLQSQFEEAVTKGRTLRITFVNKFVTKKSVERFKLSEQEWTKDGIWRGKCKNGWDGGADFFHKGFLKRVEDRTAHISRAETIHHARRFDVLEKQPDNSGWRTFTGQSTKRCIRFAKSFEFRSFLPDSMPSELRPPLNCEMHGSTESMLKDDQASPTDKQERTIDDLKAITLDGTYKDVQNLFEQGSLTDLQTLQALTEALKKADALLEQKLKRDPDNFDLGKQKKSNYLKRVCLKIYTRALFIVNEARWLKNWERFRLEITELCDIKLSDKVDSPYDGKIKVEIFIADTNKREQLPSLPYQPFTGNIMYRKENAKVKDNVVKVNFNSMLSSKRSVELRISIVLPDQNPALLGTVEIHLAELNRNFPADRNLHFVRFPLKPNEFIDHAEVHLQFCRDTVDDGYINSKRENALANFRTLFTWIEPFEMDVKNWNKDFNDDLQPVGADVKVVGNLGLLHAAVFLKDEKLVKTLLHLGADPTSKSEVGSALTLAQNMADGHSWKQKHIRNEFSTNVLAENDDENIPLTEGSDNDSVLDVIIKSLREYRNKLLEEGNTKQMENFHSSHSLNRPKQEAAVSPSKDKDLCELLLLDQPNWLHQENDPEPCKFWSSQHKCKETMCQNMHVQAPWKDQGMRLQQQMDHDQPGTFYDDIARRAVVLDRDVDGKKLYTAGIRDFAIGHAFDPFVIVYAEGRSSKVSRQGISWYDSRKEAIDALKWNCAISNWAFMKGIVPTEFEGQEQTTIPRKQPLAFLCPNWLGVPERYICFRWRNAHTCQYNLKCQFIHVHGPWGEQLDELYKSIGAPQVDDDKFDHKVKFLSRNENGLQLYTAAYDSFLDNPTSESTREIMYSEGGPAKVSKSGGISWYLTKKEAKKALRKVYIVSKWAANNGIRPYRFQTTPTLKKRKGFPYHRDDESELGKNSTCKRRRESDRVEQVSDFGVHFQQPLRTYSWSHPERDFTSHDNL